MGKKVIVMLLLGAFLMMTATESFARMGRGSSSGFRSYKPQRSVFSNTKPAEQLPVVSAAGTARAEAVVLQQRHVQRPHGRYAVGRTVVHVHGTRVPVRLSGPDRNSPHRGDYLFPVQEVCQAKADTELSVCIECRRHCCRSRRHIREAGRSAQSATINEQFVKDIAQSTYKTLQGAWSKGDLSPVKNLITPRMYDYLTRQLEELNAQGLKNIVEIVYIGEVNIVEVEEEDDNKVAVVRIDAMLRDYTVDKNNVIVEGSKDTPADAREYWAFVGKALDWKLDDIKQV